METSPRRAAARLGVALALTLVVVATPAQGHALYVCSSPNSNAILQAAPSLVSVCLSEEVAQGSASIRVTDSTGVRHDLNGTRISATDARTILTDLANVTGGVYTVTWGATSAVDGHYAAGSFAFGVEDNGTFNGTLPDVTATTPPPPSVVEVALRAASYLTLAAAVGAAALVALVWSPATRRGEDASREPSLKTLRFLLLWGAGNAGAFCAVTLSWLAYSVGVSAAGGASVSLTTPFNLSMLARIGFAGAAAGLMFVALRRPLLPTKALDPLLIAAFASMLAAVAAVGAASHAAANADLPAGAVLDSVHLGAVTTWVGGLVALALVRPALMSPVSVPVSAAALVRFSKLATVCVGLVLGGGLLLALREVGSIDRLYSTAFGNVVLAKAFLFMPLIAIGAWNHFNLVPSLARPSKRGPALSSILSRVRFEVAFGAVILVLAGLLTALSPAIAPALPPAEPFVLHQTQGDIRIDLQSYPTPSVPQVYTLSLTLWNATTGDEFYGATNLTFRFTLENSSLPPSDVAFEGPHGNHFFSDTPALSQPGTWRLDGTVEVPGGSDLTFTFKLTVRGA